MENVLDLENFTQIKSCVAFYCMVLHVVVCYHCMVLISQILHLASKRVGWGEPVQVFSCIDTLVVILSEI